MTSPDYGLLEPGRVGAAVESATGDSAYLQALLDAEAALVRAQVSLGLVPESAGRAVTEAADAGNFDVRSIAVRAKADGNPVIALVSDLKAVVAKIDSDAAEYVHRAATSQDIVDTATMLVASRTLEIVLRYLDRTAAALGNLAVEHRDTVMVARTLTQHAVPTTFGLKVAGWRSIVLAACDRLAALELPAQLGGAAGTLAAFGDAGLDLVDAFAAELGLLSPGLPWHVLRAPIADLGGALAFTSGALGKIAADVLVMSRTEIGEVSEASGGRSSAMPHKSNPIRATLIAATARQVPALVSVLFSSLAAEDERPAGAWHAEWQPLREALRLVGGAAEETAELVATLRVHPDRMRANLGIEIDPAGNVGSAGALVDRALGEADDD